MKKGGKCIAETEHSVQHTVYKMVTSMPGSSTLVSRSIYRPCQKVVTAYRVDWITDYSFKDTISNLSKFPFVFAKKPEATGHFQRDVKVYSSAN